MRITIELIDWEVSIDWKCNLCSLLHFYYELHKHVGNKKIAHPELMQLEERTVIKWNMKVVSIGVKYWCILTKSAILFQLNFLLQSLSCLSLIISYGMGCRWNTWQKTKYNVAILLPKWYIIRKAGGLYSANFEVYPPLIRFTMVLWRISWTTSTVSLIGELMQWGDLREGRDLQPPSSCIKAQIWMYRSVSSVSFI